MAKAYTFRRKLGVPTPHGGKAGHVAWGFTLPDGEGIYCGSTENPNSMPWHPVGGDNGWWAKQVPDEAAMLDEMRKHLYDDYKVHDLEEFDAKKARLVADNCKEVGYSFTGNNCLDHAYQILCHYGAIDLPLPLEQAYPNAWFSSVPWEWHSLK